MRTSDPHSKEWKGVRSTQPGVREDLVQERGGHLDHCGGGHKARGGVKRGVIPLSGISDHGRGG